MAPNDDTRWQTTRVQDVVRAQIVVPCMAQLLRVLVALHGDRRFKVGHIQRDDGVGTTGSAACLQCLVYGSMVDDEDKHVVEITVSHAKAHKTFDMLGEWWWRVVACQAVGHIDHHWHISASRPTPTARRHVTPRDRRRN